MKLRTTKKLSFDKRGWKLCVVVNCRCKVRRSRKRNKCAKHHGRWFKEAHPLEYSFAHLRQRAKERGIEFRLAIEQYKEFAAKTDYASLKGKSGLSLSIDRIDPRKGYTAENIQAITLRENSRKQWTDMPAWMKAEMKEAESATNRPLQDNDQ